MQGNCNHDILVEIPCESQCSIFSKARHYSLTIILDLGLAFVVAEGQNVMDSLRLAIHRGFGLIYRPRKTGNNTLAGSVPFEQSASMQALLTL